MSDTLFGCVATGAVCIFCLLAAGCRADSGSIDRQAEAYVRLVLALGERDPDSLDFFAGPVDWQTEAHAKFATFPEIKRDAAALAEAIASGREADPATIARRHFLTGQLRAVSARIDLVTGRHFTFSEEAGSLFGVTVDPADVPAGIREELERLLPGGSSLARRYDDFDRQFLIPRDRVPLVIGDALAECRRRTAAHLSLPHGETVTVAYVHETPWSAFTRYEGHGRSRIEINADFDLTVDRALSLACHEAYPGHHTINVLIESAHPDPEFLVVPLYSPLTFKTEGAATFAPDLAFSDDERLAFERDVLFPAAGLNRREAELYLRVSRLVARLRGTQQDILRQYLDGTLEFARAAAALEEKSLMAAPDATLKFFNRFRTYALTYTLGPDRVARALAAAPERWQAYAHWVTELK